MNRRHFMRVVGLGAVGAAVGSTGLAAADDTAVEPAAQEAWQELDSHHQAGVQAFLDHAGKDDLFWNRRMEPEMDGDVKVFRLTAQENDWETMPGTVFPAMAYNGIVPGPEIRVTKGDRVRVVLTNEMTQSTAIHFHGLLVPNNMDGVPFINQPMVEPGATFTYEFTVRNAGSHMYHSHHNAAEQVTRGLLGAFIVDPADTAREPEVVADYTLILNDSTLGFTLNGKSFPYTQPIVASLGDKIRVRYMNEGLMIHPFHLHGIPQLVFAKDGYALPTPFLCDTLNVAPGERYDVLLDCTEPGVWAYHCHVLTHAESRNRMFGMVTVLIVNE